MSGAGTGRGRPQHPFHVAPRDLWAIALPACLAFVTEPLAGMIHTAVIGRMGDAGLIGGISLGAVAFNMMLALAFFLRFGTAGLTAQAVGARDPLDGLLHLGRALVFAVALGLLVLLLSGPILRGYVAWFAPPGGSLPAFEAYFRVRIWSVPFVLVNYVLLGWFYGRARATTGLLLQLLINGVNTVFSITLVTGLGWGVGGLAFAKILGEVAAALIGLGLVLRHYGGLRRILGAASWAEVTEMAALRRMLELSRDLTIRSLALNAAFAYFTASAGKAGETALAATGVLLQIAGFANFMLDGLATAVEQLCGRAVGANWRPAFERTIRLGLGWGMALAVALFLALMALGGPIIDLVSTSPEVRGVARAFLVMTALIPLTGMPAYVYDGVMIGATLNRIMRNGMLISLAVFLAAALALQSAIGLWGLWAALHLMLMVRAAIYARWIDGQKPRLFDEPRAG